MTTNISMSPNILHLLIPTALYTKDNLENSTKLAWFLNVQYHFTGVQCPKPYWSSILNMFIMDCILLYNPNVQDDKMIKCSNFTYQYFYRSSMSIIKCFGGK